MHTIALNLHHLMLALGYHMCVVEFVNNDNYLVVYFNLTFDMDKIELFPLLRDELEPHGYHLIDLVHHVNICWNAKFIVPHDK